MTARSRAAFLVAALPFLIVALLYFLGGGERLFPEADPADITSIEIRANNQQVTLARKGDGWILPSAADAPGDTARIEGTLKALLRLAGDPLPPEQPAPTREPLTVTLRGANGMNLGTAGFWAGEAARIDATGATELRLAVDDLPALPHWPSAWSSLRPPAIPAASVLSASDITPDGMTALDTAQTQAVARMLAGLSAQGFDSAANINWAGSRLIRVELRDGASIDLQLRPADGQGWLLRLTSDDRPDIRDLRHYAFRTQTAPIPNP